MLKSIRKADLPLGSVIYYLKQQCDAEYIGRSNQRLEAMIDQYVPAKIPRRQYKNLHTLVNASGSAIAEYLTNNSVCVSFFTRFISQYLAKYYHLRVFVTLYIKSKPPSRCKLYEWLLSTCNLSVMHVTDSLVVYFLSRFLNRCAHICFVFV